MWTRGSLIPAAKLTFDRNLTIHAALVPVAEYGGVRGFFQKTMDAEQSPVVLVRK